MVEHPVEVEVAPKLACGQAAELVPERASAQEVGCASPHLSRTRPAQREVNPSVLHEPVDFVQKGGGFLYLVDHDLPRSV